ncbi:MAG: hypothetical protein P1U77_15685 [Rubripirellula sp.]|nr:hypothetical protein [Rubripirellula sp.]
MESPYQPPQEIARDSYSMLHAATDASQYTPDEQQKVLKLGKYLSELGGFLLFTAVILGLFLVFNGFTNLQSIPLSGFSPETISFWLEVSRQAANIFFLGVIGVCMRRAAVPLRRSLHSADNPMADVMRSMLKLNRLYAWKIIYATIGIVILLATMTS